MTNVEKLAKLEVLDVIRLRHGAETPEEQSKDYTINQLSNLELVADYCGWKTGDNYLWYSLFNLYIDLNKLS
jgi:hypothetical protein